MPSLRLDLDTVHDAVATRLRIIIASAEKEWGNSTDAISDILSWTWKHLFLRRDEEIPHAFDVLTAHGWEIESATTIISAALLEEHFLSIHATLHHERNLDEHGQGDPSWISLPGVTDHDRRSSALIAADLCAVMSSSLLADLDAPASVRVAGLRALSEGVMARSIHQLRGMIDAPKELRDEQRLLDLLVHAMTDNALLTASPRDGVPPEHIS